MPRDDRAHGTHATKRQKGHGGKRRGQRNARRTAAHVDRYANLPRQAVPVDVARPATDELPTAKTRPQKPAA